MKRLLYYIKKYIIKIFSEYYRYHFCTSKQRIILLDMPNHSNIGDHAIAFAEKEFIDKELNISEKSIFEFTRQEWIYLKKELVSSIHKDDIIILPGGGYMGSLWPDEEDTIIDILNCLKMNHIIIFPQTIFFEDSTYGRTREKELLDAVRNCNDIVIFSRDIKTYEMLHDNSYFQMENIYLTPDIVTYLTPEFCVKRKKMILLVMRNDLEKTISDLNLENICKENFEDYDVKLVSMHFEKNITPTKRRDVLTEKWEQFAEAALVITDRLHGMLFAAINGTPCIAFDNCSNKVSGQYEWIKNLNYIYQINESDFSIDLVRELLDYGEGMYSNSELKGFYDLIKKQIQMRIIE